MQYCETDDMKEKRAIAKRMTEYAAYYGVDQSWNQPTQLSMAYPPGYYSGYEDSDIADATEFMPEEQNMHGYPPHVVPYHWMYYSVPPYAYSWPTMMGPNGLPVQMDHQGLPIAMDPNGLPLPMMQHHLYGDEAGELAHGFEDLSLESPRSFTSESSNDTTRSDQTESDSDVNKTDYHQ